MTGIETIRPADIERRSFEIIESELARPIDPALAPIVKRVIHTTADFEYADSLCFSKNAVSAALAALKQGACIVTDTNMAKAGLNSRTLEQLGCQAVCFMADNDVAQAAKRNGTTRAVTSVEKAAALPGRQIFVVGNAPTALIRICEMIKSGELSPVLVIGVPVGFVNVVQAKELLMQTGAEHIVARGRKGGSNVAAAIVNALMYMLTRDI